MPNVLWFWRRPGSDLSQVQAEAGEAAKILQTEPKYVPALMVSGMANERARNFACRRIDADSAGVGGPSHVCVGGQTVGHPRRKLLY